jgi:DNA-binding MarR family transcriptional regulator
MATATPIPTDEMPQLAADLGRVLETLVDETGQGLAQRAALSGLTPLHGRIMRQLDRAVRGLRASEIAERAGLDPQDTASAAAELRRDRLVVRDQGGALTLTRTGRTLVAEFELARRSDLRAYVDRLDDTGRRRLAAALSLLDDDDLR